MKLVADLHIHSRYSRATSPDMNIDSLSKYAKMKGLNLLGTGDYTHPSQMADMKRLLKLDSETGFYVHNGMNFVPSTEVSLIYTQNGKGYRVHHCIVSPDIETAEQITEWLKTRGRVDYDGRPIFNIPTPEFVEKVMEINKDNFIFPAHCLLPDTILHCNPDDKKIKEVQIGDKVLTHKCRFKTIKQVYTRNYSGKVHKIVPWYFREGLTTTPEHPFFVIKSLKKCSWIKGVCKPLCSQRMECKRKYYSGYKPEWVQAKNLEVGDFLLYPRPIEIKDVDSIKLNKLVNCKLSDSDKILPQKSKNKKNMIHNTIQINNNFCRLAGYYIAEGYLVRNEAVGFSFHAKEKEYANEVIMFMKESFGVTSFKIDNRRENQMDIVFYSHILNELFKQLFYTDGSRAWNKCIPDWMILLPDPKIAEILRGWWRGDTGYTVSRKLANQMKMICLKLGIIPSIGVETAEKFNMRKHITKGRTIKTVNDTIVFSNLSFFEEDYDMLKEKCFRKFVNKKAMKHGWIDKNYAYLPIRTIKFEDYDGLVYNLEVEDDNSYVTEFATVHNCWTPWFSMFGSESGFNSAEECFGDSIRHIHAIETGLSSDPAMNWRLSQLDRFCCISNSDCHSPWPNRLGREANVFELAKPSLKSMLNAIKTKNKSEFLYTIETSPLYGKYHYDGHRACNICLSPKESIAQKDICPKCHKGLTIGVEHRVEELADRPEGFKPAHAIPFKSILPLQEIISAIYLTAVGTKTVSRVFDALMAKFPNELHILLDAKEEELCQHVDRRLAKAIMLNREGKVTVKPGYDGEYGVPEFPKDLTLGKPTKQKSLGEF
ncbi:MAG: hypothetical protein PHC66_01695 [Candidatus Nanoarchaeia archaeon]|nr:hypothetical protein [Candidatus Nanoarchaeia archaeon]MDD5238925.1 hypothetical protein [Candidatus Nanoarchaeia archaeon]